MADAIEDWFAAGAADGFNVMPPALPSGLEVFAGHVVPILQKRGLFHRDYPGRTLREHYGLPRPANQYLAAREPAAMRELPIRPRAGRATPRRGSSRSGG